MKSLQSDSFTTEPSKSSALKHIIPPIHWNNYIPYWFAAGWQTNADLTVWGICQWGKQLCWVYTEERRQCAGSASLHPLPACQCEGSCSAKHKAHPLQLLLCLAWQISEYALWLTGESVIMTLSCQTLITCFSRKYNLQNADFSLIPNRVDQPVRVLRPTSASLVLHLSREAGI